MFRTLAALLIVACVTVLPAQAQQAASPPSRLDDIIQRGILRVGIPGDYKPFGYFDPKDAKFEGFDIDMATSLAHALGVKLEVVKTSWPSLMADFTADKFDVAMGGISITLDRQKKGYFSTPVMHEGKTPIARCADVGKYDTLADIDKPETRVIVNPGGTNERFARAHIKNAEIAVYPDNVTIFDEIANGRADVMMTDSSETRFQQKLHPGVLCAVHPEKPFDFAEKAYWLQRDVALKAFVDQWLHIAQENGNFRKVYTKWFQ